MNAQHRERIRKLASEADSALDVLYLRLAALPAPWTLVATVAIAAAIAILGFFLGAEA